MKGARILFMASCAVLLLVSAMIALAALASVRVAFVGRNDDLARRVTIEEIRTIGGDEAVNNYRGRRITAATWALGYAVLSGLIVMVPYRRGERWAWWALFVAVVASQLLSMGRVVALGTTLGIGTAGAVVAFSLLGLLAGVPRIFFSSEASSL
jgi:hypothetical protein